MRTLVKLGSAVLLLAVSVAEAANFGLTTFGEKCTGKLILDRVP